MRSLQAALTTHPFDVGTRRLGDLLLFSVTAAELAMLIRLTPTFTFLDWIYLWQHLIVLGLAFTRRAPRAQDHSGRSAIAVIVSYAYPYGQIVYLGWRPGEPVSQTAGLVLVTIAAVLSLAGLLSLGTSFGVRPALRTLVARGPYQFVRHPIYAAYVLSDIGYNLQEWNLGTLLLTFAGWTSLFYRIDAEERVLSRDESWLRYVRTVPSRLIPGVW